MPNAPHPVFLSYARRASREPVRALRAALAAAGVPAYLDERDVRYGDPIPGPLADALLGARVVVVFFEPVYFTRWYCRLEYRLATALFPHDARAAEHVVLAFPDSGAAPDAQLEADRDELPPELRERNWPAASETDRLVALVKAQLAECAEPLGAALDRHMGVDAARAILTGPAALPQPLQVGPVPSFTPDGMRRSLRAEFVGREADLWQLHQALAPAEQRVGHAALTAALKGMGGVGKTQLAAEYFWRYGPRHYTGGLFWLDARRDAAEQHHAVLRALGDAGVGEDFAAYREQVGAARVAAALAGRLTERLRAMSSEHPVLLVVDDVPEPNPPAEAGAAVPKPLPLETWCPAPERTACLATSRAVVGFRGGGALTRQAVNVLALGPAVDLLTRGVDEADGLAPEEWAEIAEWVGRLPLALTLLNRAFQPDAQALHPDEVLTEVRLGRSAAQYQDTTAAALTDVDETLRGATAAFRLSYDRLPAAAQRAVRALACLGPAPIPRALAEVVAPDLADVGTRALLLARSFVLPPEELGGRESIPAHNAVPGGATRSVVEPRVPSVTMLGSMHALLADAVRTFATDVNEDAQAVIAALYEVFGTERSADPTTEWPLLARCSPHAFAAVALYEKASLQSGVASAPSPVVNLLIRVGNFEQARGDYAAALAAHDRALALAERLLGSEHQITFTSAGILASTLYMLGDLAGARAHQERVLEAHARLLGDEHEYTLVSAINLAETLHTLGEFARARGYQERVLDVQTRLLGPEHHHTLVTANNLASTLAAIGDHPGARAQRERVLAMRTRVVGPEHPDTLVSASNLAETLRALGDLPGARAHQERVLAIQSRTLGLEHPNTLITAGNLAGTLHEQGDLARARGELKRVLELQTRLLGPDHPATLASANSLARTLLAQGDLSEAHAEQERVLAARTRLLGPEHPATLTSLHNLAATVLAQGNRTRARDLLERVVESFTRVLGATHPKTVQATRNLAFAVNTRDAGDWLQPPGG